MKSIYVCLLLGLFSCVLSHKLAEEYYGDNILLQHWGGGEDTVSWCKAEHKCQVNGGTLAIPKTSGLNNAIVKLIRYATSTRAWIGGSDMIQEQNWRWNDGSWISSGYTNWNAGEPNDEKGEDCVEFFGIGLWNDKDCGITNEYICQIDLTKTTKSDFVAFAFSDSFPEGSKSATSINEARKECKNRGLKLVLDVKSIRTGAQIQQHLVKFTGAKYCIDDENNGRMMDVNGMLDQECAGQPFLYICEGYRPHYLKISDDAPIVQESGNLEIECTADGNPLPDVVWHKNYDHVITTDTNASIHQEMSPGKSTLVIKNAKQGDADRYRCSATNNINGEEHSSGINTELEVRMNPN